MTQVNAGKTFSETSTYPTAAVILGNNCLTKPYMIQRTKTRLVSINT